MIILIEFWCWNADFDSEMAADIHKPRAQINLLKLEYLYPVIWFPFSSNWGKINLWHMMNLWFLDAAENQGDKAACIYSLWVSTGWEGEGQLGVQDPYIHFGGELNKLCIPVCVDAAKDQGEGAAGIHRPWVSAGGEGKGQWGVQEGYVYSRAWHKLSSRLWMIQCIFQGYHCKFVKTCIQWTRHLLDKMVSP